MNGQVCRRVEGQTDGWMDGWKHAKSQKPTSRKEKRLHQKQARFLSSSHLLTLCVIFEKHL